jgi:predicted secreted hydrolase
MRSELLGLALGLAVAAGPVAGPPPSAGPRPASATTPAAASTAGFRAADPTHPWSFPRDHFARRGYRNEWWYFTGTLAAAGGRRFGWQVTFFKVGLLPARPPLASAWASDGAVMVHAAVTDLADGKHVFAETLWRNAPLLAGLGVEPGPRVAWAQAPPGTPGRWTLDLEGQTWRLAVRDDRAGLALSLSAVPRRPTVLQGPNGYSRKAAAEGFASEYYSQTRLAVEGTLALGGAGQAVRGEGWMDREVGSSQLAPAQVGWDWFALRLRDGRDLMLYLLRRADGTVDWRNAALVSADGTASALAPEAWSVRATGRWRSPETGAEYPAGWHVEVRGSAALALDVEPEVPAAENRSRLVKGLFYWEGPVRVIGADGAGVGEGYVELTGYGAGSRPPL